MEIPFDGILTLLIFLVGIPALVLQLISPAERRATMKENRLDVRKFLMWAISVTAIGLFLEFVVALAFTGVDYEPLNKLSKYINLIQQGIELNP